VSRDDGRSRRDSEAKRRGISGAAKALRDTVRQNGGRDPGQEAAERRVRQAVLTNERKRKE